DAGLEHDPRRDEDRSLAEPHAVADRRAVSPVGIAALLRRERAERIGIRSQRLEELFVELSFRLGQLELRWKAHAVERDAREEPRGSDALLRVPPGHEPLDVLGGDE